MKLIIRTSLSLIVLLVLSACSFPAPAPQPVLPGSLELRVQTQNGVSTFSRAGEVVNYNYIVTNKTSSALAGGVTITDGTRTIGCPDVKTVGNGDANLDVNETITCTLGYTTTDADVNTGSITNIATASAGGVTSNQSGVTLTRVQAGGILKLTKSPGPTTYGAVGQTIGYNFTITNTGATPLGPTQFLINDDKLGASLPCGPADTTLQPAQPVTCTINYQITQADMGVASITNNASASGAGQISAPVSATITNITVTATPVVPPIVTPLPQPSGSTCPTSQQQAAAGSTCLHQVEVGEWLIQIGRCYGVSLSELVSANRQIQNPNLILPSMVLTVPRLGSAGKIYGRPCITFYTVQSGDTWNSVAQRFNADVAVLQRVNPNGLIAGQPAKIPLNSAGGAIVTAVPGAPTATPTGTTAPPAAQRITIPAGQTATSLAGVVNPGQTVSYVITAAQGQLLAVSLTGPANTEVTLGVFGPTGLALKSPDGAFSWNSTVTTPGDHTITVNGLGGAPNKNYLLTVSLTAGTTPVAATPITAVP